MSETDTPQERQENEMQALMAIFSHDLQDLRKPKVWGAWSPVDIVIRLMPQQGSSGCHEVHVTVSLHVTCSENYPDEPPTILLEKSKGLSAEKITQLSMELKTLAQQLVGEVMVFELAQHVQKFLHAHNKPGFKSFYEEMVLRQQEQHHKQQLVRKQQEDMQRQVILGEILRKQEVLREEKQERKRESSHHRSRDRSQTVSESSESSCDLVSPRMIKFNNRSEREIYRGKCLGHSLDGTAVHSGLDLQSGELFAVITWTFRGDLSYIFKQLSSIEQELNYLQRLQHSHLVRYLNMTYSQNQDAIVVHLLQEFVHGTTLSFYTVNHMAMDIEILRFCASGILAALLFLHKNNIVHKNLRASSVFLEKSGKILVTDYSIDRRLRDIPQSDSGCAVSSGRWSKKTDIHQLGVLLLSLLRGETLTGPLELEIPPSLTSDCKDFLHRCLVGDENQKWSAGQLLGHSFFKSSVRHGNINKKNSSQKQQDDQEEDLDVEPIPTLPVNSQGHSRIHSDFEVLKSLGQGAFGNVLKVRNKLDGGVYAIKCIKLNPQNKQLNRKITREVKLLSRLNHENVVRYFNSWIECATLDCSTSSTNSESVASQPAVPQKLENKLMTASSDVERLAPPLREVSVRWNLSHQSRASVIHSDSSSSDDSSDDDYMGFLANGESSDAVVFNYDGSQCVASNTKESEQVTSHNGALSEKRPISNEVQFMYIQMEFCEKSTLRTAIDSGLYEDELRVWRLFREVVEGLAHIHQQGIIHRDLKPVNIFLDSNDHVKIGDFGLATTYILPRPAAAIVLMEHAVVDRRVAEAGSVSEILDGSLTGQVGTALYVAPELSASGFKTLYNQKVDIYSLGIIFFEMCCPPLETGMERVKMLANLRHPDVIVPSNFSDQRMQRQVHIIRWLLNHDPTLRPTSQELLQSSYLPPPQLEEASLQEMVRHTLSNPQSKAYKYLVGSCFKQEVGPAEDITYHMSLVRGPSPCMQELAKQTVARVFHKHGAVCLTTPLLSPPNQNYEAGDSYVHLMARSGVVVCLPHDLRVPFARYVAWNGITFLKRYTVERVYREKKVFGFHPRELYECAFDIVTPTSGSLVADAELLSVVEEVVNEFPSLRDKACSIRLNHTALLRAALLHCGVDSDVHHNVCAVLEEAKDERQSKLSAQLHVNGTSLSDQSMATLFGLLDTEGSLSDVLAAFRILMKRRGEAASLAKQAFHELEAIISHGEALGVSWPITVAPGLVYNSHQYSGMMCQFVCELKKKRRKGGMDVLAAGGRYDSMLHTFRKTVELAGMVPREVSQSAVGVSISLDRIVSALQECDRDVRVLDVMVCSLGNSPMIKEKCAIVRELWAAGIRANLLDTIQSLEEVQDWCQEMMVSNIVLLKETEATCVRVRSWDKERERFQEKKVPTTELVDFLQRNLKTSTSEAGEITPTITRSDSKGSTICEPSPAQSVSVNFLLDDRINAVQRRRIENQVISQLANTLQKLSARVRVEILVLSVDSVVIKTLVSHLDLDADAAEFQKSMGLIVERHPRYKKYLSRISDEIQDLCHQKSRPVLVLYSREDNSFKILL